MLGHKGGDDEYDPFLRRREAVHGKGFNLGTGHMDATNVDGIA
jgi:hypothetical protein